MNKNKLCIIGLGYVGLPLAIEFAKKHEVIGFDINQTRISELKNFFDRTKEINENELKETKAIFSFDVQDIKDCNIFIVTVPTPINNNNQPDLFPLEASSKTISSVLKKNDIVIYESTVYPGCTEEICVPILEKHSNLKFNKDFYVGYSPERINPGDPNNKLINIKKITSGSTQKIADFVDELYNTILISGTHKASSIKVAEAAKVIENTQRDVNIALINELAMLFNTLGINTNEVLEAAATKWNFIKLKPGLVGGHCISVDPYYLIHQAKKNGYIPNMISKSREINDNMGKYIAEKTIQEMTKKDILISKSNVLIMGFTFKENCPDIRNTKVVDIYNTLKEYKIQVDVFDNWALPNEVKHEYGIELIKTIEEKKYDAIILAVEHKEFKEITIEKFNSYGKDNNVIIMDIKGIIKNPTWSL